jgi:hypothetical protein
MKYIIFKKENPELVVATVDSDYNPQLTNDEDLAMEFDSQSGANGFITLLPGGTEFWGSRKKRPK